MSPRTGRPIVGNRPKNKQLKFRVAETVIKRFEECVKATGRTKVGLFEEMVDELHEKVCKEKD